MHEEPLPSDNLPTIDRSPSQTQGPRHPGKGADPFNPTPAIWSPASLRQRIHERLADQEQNAFWISIAVVFAALIGVLFHLYVAIRTPEWQYIGLVIITGILFGAGIISIFLSRRGQARGGIWLLLLVGGISIAVSPILISGLGVWYAAGIMMSVLIISTLTLPSGQDTRANLWGVLAGVATLLADGFLPQYQRPAPSELSYFIPGVVAFLALVYLLVLFIYFASYNLRSKITITVFSATIISITILAVVDNLTARANLLDAVNQTLRLAARQTAADVDAYLESLALSIQTQAQAPTLSYFLLPQAQQSAADARRYLQTMQIRTGANFYAVIDRAGVVLLHTSINDTTVLAPFLGLAAAHQNSLQQVLLSGAPFISPVLFDPIAGQEGFPDQPYFLVAAQIKGADPTNPGATVPLGLVIGSFPLTQIQDAVAANSTLASETSFAVLLDENHMRIAHSLGEEWAFSFVAPLAPELMAKMEEQGRIPQNLVVTDYTDLAAGLESGESFFDATEAGTATAELNSAAVARITARPWVIVFMQPQRITLQPVVTQTRTTILLAAGVTGLTIILSTFLASLLTNPISNLTVVAERAAAGNLYIQAPIESTDEIGTLSIAFNSMINQLRQTLTGLEQRVADRTAELAQSSEQMSYRAARLQTVAEVAHTIVAEQDLDTLLPLVTNTISERFGFYHVGIFLLDQDEEYAVLQAANSEGGQRMLKRGHQLKVGQVGLVGYVTAEGQPRIALDVGKDAVFFDNPDLPHTRSEIALPLKTADKIIGALDVQSQQSKAFSQDDIALLSTLADQVAMSIANARLFSETSRALRELQVAQRQYLRQEWGRLMAQRRESGYYYQLGKIRPLETALPASTWTSLDTPSAQAERSESDRPPVADNSTAAAEPSGLLVPIRLRGEIIGLINLEDPALEHAWTAAEIQLANSVADQIGLALENARLLEETQRRAERERLVSDITTRLRASNDPHAILETAVTELKNALSVKQVRVLVNSPVSDRSQNDRPPVASDLPAVASDRSPAAIEPGDSQPPVDE